MDNGLHGHVASYALKAAALTEETDRRELDAAVLLADVIGFTRMAERLCRQPAGTEMLSDHLNRYFGRMIDHIDGSGGEVAGFAGDALLAVWESPDFPGGQAEAVHRAAACALGLRNLGQDLGAPGVRLRISVAAGGLTARRMPGPDDHQRWILGGPALRSASRVNASATPQQVAIDPTASTLLPQANRTQTQAGCSLITDVSPSPRSLPERSKPDVQSLKALVPAWLRSLDTGAFGGWLAEMRTITVLFLYVPEVDVAVATDEPAMRMIEELAQQAYRHEQTFAKISVDWRGSTFMIALGQPHRPTDRSALTALRLALDLAGIPPKYGRKAGIGVATGRAYWGLVGNRKRCEYTLIGDAVNTASRVASAAADKTEELGVRVLSDEATYEASRHLVRFEQPVEMLLKGRSSTVWAYQAVPGPVILGDAQRTQGVLIGRVPERHAIEECLDSLVDGGPRALIIRGEPGSGKSRLLGHVEEEAAKRGIRFVAGSGEAAGVPGPYHAWREVLADLLDLDHRVSAEARAEQVMLGLGRQRQQLAPLLNLPLGINLEDSEETALLQGERRAQAVRNLMIELVELVEEAAATPLVLCFDDTQWLDTLSWALIKQLATGLRRTMLVLCARNDPLAATSEADNLASLIGATTLHLGPLSRREVEELAQSRMGGQLLPADVASVIARKSGGNPLFVEEMVQALMFTPQTHVDSEPAHGGVGSLADDPQIPGTLEEVIGSRLDALDPQARLIIKVASAVGASFPAEVVEAVLPVTIPRDRLPELFANLEKAQLTIADLRREKPHYRFRHVLIRDVAYSRMLQYQRQELHRLIATYYEQAPDGDLPDLYLTLAHHWAAARVTDKACYYLSLASEQAVNNGMGAEAVRLGLQAAALLGVSIPQDPQAVESMIVQTQEELRGLVSEPLTRQLESLPTCTNERIGRAIGILLATEPAAFMSQQAQMFALLGLKAFQLTLEHGVTDFTPGVVSIYAMLIRPTVLPAEFCALGEFAKQLAETNSPRFRSYAGFVYSWFLHHWLHPLRTGLQDMQRQASAGFADGDIMFGCFNAAGYVVMMARSGAPLAEVASEAAAASDRVNGRVAAAAFHCLHEAQVAKALIGKTVHPCSFTDRPEIGPVDEDADLATITQTDLFNEVGYYYSSKARLHYYFGDYLKAIDFAERAQQLLPAFAGQAEEAELVFFHALALLAQTSPSTQSLTQVKTLRQRIAGWEQNAPANFMHKRLMIDALLAHHADKPDALDLLGQAARSALDQGLIHHAALAHELNAQCLGQNPRAAAQLREAASLYRRWGALAKEAQLASVHPEAFADSAISRA